MGTSLYERVGGDAIVPAAVDLFYRNALADGSISHFFDAIDMAELHAKLTNFLVMALGGPAQHNGVDLRRIHAPMVVRGLNDAHFNAVLRHLRHALEELGVAEDVITEVLAVAESTRDDILGR